MLFALVEAAKAVSAHRLHDPNVNVSVIKLHEAGAVEIEETRQAVEIMIEQLLAQVRGQVGLSVIQKRSDVILQRAFTAALVVEEKGLWFVRILARNFTHHDIARLKIAVEEIIATGAQQEFHQAAEVAFQRLFVEWNAGEPEKVILEIIEIPRDRLAIEAGAGIADFIVQVASGFDLKAGQYGYHFAIGRNRLGSNDRSVAMAGKKFEKSSAAEVFFQISALTQIFGINFGHGQTVAAKMTGKFEEGYILFAHVIENADGADAATRKAYDLAARAAKLALQRLRTRNRRVEMLLEQFF